MTHPHQVTPWVVAEDGCAIEDLTGQLVVDFGSSDTESPETDKANAAHIVKCVNIYAFAKQLHKAAGEAIAGWQRKKYVSLNVLRRLIAAHAAMMEGSEL